jgi:serine/threonine protein phosphatase PrpC
MAFSLFSLKKPEILFTPPSVMDLLVTSQRLLDQLRGSALPRLPMEKQRLKNLRSDAAELAATKSSSTEETAMREDVQRRIEEADRLIAEWEGAETIPPESAELLFEVASITRDKETRERFRRNEDTALVDKKHDLFGVFDGLGGQAAGDKASRSAAKQLEEAAATLPETASLAEAEAWMMSALEDADARVRAESLGDGRGTTASVIKFWEGAKGERKAIIGNVGDSRVYRFREGVLEQMTLDDSTLLPTSPEEAEATRALFTDELSGSDTMRRALEEFLARDMLTREEVFSGMPASPERALEVQAALSAVSADQDLSTLPPYLRLYFEFSHFVGQSLGDGMAKPRVQSVDVQPGDLFFAVSDGISDNLSSDEIQKIVASSQDLEQVGTELANAAKNRARGSTWRAKKDDMTVVFAKAS